jgi:hypothetical protein
MQKSKQTFFLFFQTYGYIQRDLTALHIAAYKGDLDTVAMLVKSGCDTHARNDVSYLYVVCCMSEP